MQPCDDRIPELVDLASGELTGPARNALERHLALCPGCRAEAQLLGGVERTLQRTNPPVDDLFLASFASRTADQAERYRDRTLRGIWWSLARATRFAVGLSATALAASLSLVVLTAHTHRPAPLQESAPALAAEESASDTGDTTSIDLLGSREIGVMQTSAEAAPARAPYDDTYDVTSLDQTLEGLSTEELDQLTQMLGQSPT